MRNFENQGACTRQLKYFGGSETLSPTVFSIQCSIWWLSRSNYCNTLRGNCQQRCLLFWTQSVSSALTPLVFCYNTFHPSGKTLEDLLPFSRTSFGRIWPRLLGFKGSRDPSSSQRCWTRQANVCRVDFPSRYVAFVCPTLNLIVLMTHSHDELWSLHSNSGADRTGAQHDVRGSSGSCQREGSGRVQPHGDLPDFTHP